MKRWSRVGLALLLLGILSMICILLMDPIPSLAAGVVAGVSLLAVISGMVLLVFGDEL